MHFYSLDDDKFNISGERVRAARLRAGLSQEQLAAKLQLEGVQLGQMAISRIENGKRVLADFEILALSLVLDVEPSWLIMGEEK